MDLHHRYAARRSSTVWGAGVIYQYIAVNEEGEYRLTNTESEAHTSWSRGGAARIVREYYDKAWNPTTGGEKPVFEIVKVRRPIKIAHPHNWDPRDDET